MIAVGRGGRGLPMMPKGRRVEGEGRSPECMSLGPEGGLLGEELLDGCETSA